jgi:hypothetical protein
MISKQDQVWLARVVKSLPPKGEKAPEPPVTEEKLDEKGLPPALAKDEFKKGDEKGNDKQDKGKKPFKFGKKKDDDGDKDDKGKKGDTTVTCKISKEEIDNMFAEKHEGFKKVEASARASGAKNPGAVAAAIGMKKYGKDKFEKAAHAGRKLAEETAIERTKRIAVEIEKSLETE